MKYSLLLYFLIIACNQSKKVQWKRGHEIVTATINKDSLYEGMVYFENERDGTSRYSIYENGILNGPTVFFDKDGNKTDSLNWLNGNREGFAYIFNKHNNVISKLFYFKDRPLGHTYIYNLKGDVSHYYFSDFNGDDIYEEFPDSSKRIFARGEILNAKVVKQENGQKKYDELFLYLVNPPSEKISYKLAILDSSKKVIASQEIPMSSCFYERELPQLPNGSQYAIELHFMKPFGDKENIFTYLLEPGTVLGMNKNKPKPFKEIIVP